ncbi:C-factor-like [Spea bombifrons]|uniref:C-factor-like n=1 Tax=Spea bombifrons TaxID=233779 RepID=UPI00234BA2D3|nr:C-factor-like [Spea bombifrons]
MAGVNAESILVTGSNRGIGLELVKTFLKTNPQHVFAACRNPETAQELISLASTHQNLHIIQLDVADLQSIKAAYQAVQEKLQGRGLNILINNAGVATYKTVETSDEADMIYTYKTNTIAPMVITQEFMPLLKKAASENPAQEMSSSKACVINISSVMGSIAEVCGEFSMYLLISYRASKAALNMLTRCQAEAYRANGILFVALHPGWVQTGMGGQGAQISAEESVGGMMEVFSKLSEKDSGTFVDWRGNTVPW